MNRIDGQPGLQVVGLGGVMLAAYDLVFGIGAPELSPWAPAVVAVGGLIAIIAGQGKYEY